MAKKDQKHPVHSCKAIVFNCIDWRLHPDCEKYFQKKYKTYDMFYTAGSVKGLLEEGTKDLFLKQIEISRNLHSSKTVALTAHHDCGAFGGMANFKDKKEELSYYKQILDDAKKIVLAKFPDAKIEKYFIDLEFLRGKWKISVKGIK
jgi:carbonic anhydrase